MRQLTAVIILGLCTRYSFASPSPADGATWNVPLDAARVLGVGPFYRPVDNPGERCGRLPGKGRAGSSDDAQWAGALIGGVIGGLAGSRIGDGKGQVAMTMVGSALGAFLGQRIAQELDPQARHQIPRPCETQAHGRLATSGYRVKYRYLGRICTSHTRHHPGARLRVDRRLNLIHF
jgi:uncharacterized protein YcfJ